jgi:hypothetical protein
MWVTKQFGFRFLFAKAPKPFVFSTLASLAVELQDWLADFADCCTARYFLTRRLTVCLV